MTTQNCPESQFALMTTHAWGVKAVQVLPMVPPPGHKLGSLLPYVQVSLPTATVVSWSRQRLEEHHPHFGGSWRAELRRREALARYRSAAQWGTFRAVVATQWSDNSCPLPGLCQPLSPLIGAVMWQLANEVTPCRGSTLSDGRGDPHRPQEGEVYGLFCPASHG